MWNNFHSRQFHVHVHAILKEKQKYKNGFIVGIVIVCRISDRQIIIPKD